jgi:hypothetical protein
MQGKARQIVEMMQICRRIRASRDVGANYSAANPKKVVSRGTLRAKGVKKKTCSAPGKRGVVGATERLSEWMRGGKQELEAKSARRRHDKCKKRQNANKGLSKVRQGTGNVRTKGE